MAVSIEIIIFILQILKLYTIQMRVLCEVVRKRRALEACCELYEYKTKLKMEGHCEERTFTDCGMADLYLSDVPDSLTKHFEELSEGCR